MGLLGAHVSIAGGIEKAPLRGNELQCNAIQVFSKQQLQWGARPLSEQELTQFRKGLKRSTVKTVIVHDSYLINLGSHKKELLKKSREAFLEEIIRAESLCAMGLVFHPGSGGSTITEDDCLKTVAESINMLLDQTKGFRIKLCIENTAGQGYTIGYTFEQLAKIIDLTQDNDRVRVCFDMCHAFASGYEVRTEEACNKTFKEFHDIIGLDKIAVFHINDSKKDLGTRVDRHENIGYGFLGKEPFRCLVNDIRFKNVPMVLETPGGEEWFKINLKLLRGMIQ
ncbi:MAG: deoxyribonuclease IV [wastewater metagenome]|nr:deoxyribonuclease IV [Candidatus Loosdrechtia aerotolerans]